MNLSKRSLWDNNDILSVVHPYIPPIVPHGFLVKTTRIIDEKINK